jgi:hypothetical protein
MNIPTPEQISKLPKWAQDYITALSWNLDREQEAKRRLLEQQQTSPFYVREWNSGKPYNRYISAPENRIEVEHAGVKLGIYLTRKDDSQRPYGIELQYSAIGDSLGRGAAIVPSGNSTINLQAVENIR